MSTRQRPGRTRPDRAGTRPPTAAEARAAFEAERAANRERRAEQMRERFGDELPGRGIIAASWVATALFTAVSVPAAVDPERFVGLFVGVSVALFFAGCAVFVLDLVLAAARSRDDAMGIGGLFFLVGSAPRRVQLHLLGSLAVQVVVSVVAAALHPFTPLAFGTLVPTVALSLCGLWAVRHGWFEPAAPE